MDHNQKLKMVAAMKIYGGGFISALAECFLLADNNNLDILCGAFPEVVERYSHSAISLEDIEVDDPAK